MRSWARNPKVVAVVVVVTAGLAWLAFGFFGVHLLFVDDRVDEAAPVFAESGPTSSDAASLPTAVPSAAVTLSPEPAAPSTAAPANVTEPTAPEDAPVATPTASTPPPPPPPPPQQPAIVTEFEGTFVSRDHPTSGTAVVLGNGTDERFLRFEPFETDNGPDLNVYLVNSSAGGVEDFVDLGNLKGNIGDQNYEIPPHVDLTVHDTVVIWCVRFSSPFGEATLTPT
jgi:hypothetical protein